MKEINRKKNGRRKIENDRETVKDLKRTDVERKKMKEKGGERTDEER